MLTLVGTINLARHTVAFGRIPDVPVTRLAVTLSGGPKSLLGASCAPADWAPRWRVHFSATPLATASQRLTLTGIPGKPSLSNAGFSGLGAGAPAVHFTVASGHAARQSCALSRFACLPG